jgi:signal transduction histidine kinase
MTDALDEFAKALILIVDDEATQRLLTRDCLEEEGFRVEEASDGKRGLELIRELQPDLVLLDVMMPGIDGFEVCRQIRGDAAIAHTPVVVVSGQEALDDIQTGFAAGATDFLTKPVNWNLLPNRVRYVLRTSRLEQQLRVAKEIAEKASNAKTVLLSTMGHELRTPLNAIIGFSELMTHEAFGPIGPQYEEYALDIHASGVRLLNGVNDILEIVSSESENIELQRDEVGVSSLVGSVIRKLEPEAKELGIEIVNDVSDKSVSIRCDQVRLGKALFNLLSNAVKFTETGGMVRVSMTVSPNDEIALAIADNGIGISADDLPRVMEPFEQADNSLARKFEGLGLGVPVACAIAKLHGADIAYESEPGKGTTVRLTLPGSVRLTSHEPADEKRSRLSRG